MLQPREPQEVIALQPVRSLDVIGADGSPSFMGAASGLVRAGDFFHVVADDALHLASFPIGSNRPGTLTLLIEGELPLDPAARKRDKPDFEVLTMLPPSPTQPFGALLALGSGSRPNRRRGAVITLGEHGEPIAVRLLDGALLFESFDGRFAETNIEGAVFLGPDLLLFQRGNAGSPVSAIVSVSFQHAFAALEGRAAPPKPSIREVDLGTVDGTPLSFTDATLSNGRIVFSAAAERTTNAYDDGSLAGAAIGILGADDQVERLAVLEPAVKIEGIEARAADGKLLLTLVNDADDPALPAQMFVASLDLS